MSESGLRSTIGNRVYAKSVSGVRIPSSPPPYIEPVRFERAFFILYDPAASRPFIAQSGENRLGSTLGFSKKRLGKIDQIATGTLKPAAGKERHQSNDAAQIGRHRFTRCVGSNADSYSAGSKSHKRHTSLYFTEGVSDGSLGAVPMFTEGACAALFP